MKISPVLNDKLIRKQKFLILRSIFTNRYWLENMIFKVHFHLGWNGKSNSKKYKKVDQIPCLVFLFHVIRLLESQEYVMWVFQKDHAAAKIPCNWALLYSIFFARKPTWSLIKISVRKNVAQFLEFYSFLLFDIPFYPKESSTLKVKLPHCTVRRYRTIFLKRLIQGIVF